MEQAVFRAYGKLDEGQGALAYGGTPSTVFSSSQEAGPGTGVGPEVHARLGRF